MIFYYPKLNKLNFSFFLKRMAALIGVTEEGKVRGVVYIEKDPNGMLVALCVRVRVYVYIRMMRP